MQKTWFDRLLLVLQRMDTRRLLLLRDVVTALAERRQAEEQGRGYSSIEAAIVSVAENLEN